MQGSASFRRQAVAGDPEQAARLVRALTYLVIVGVSAGFFWAYRQGYYQGLPFPHNTFLFNPGAHFSDLSDFYGPLRGHDPYATHSTYPPFAFIAMEPFSWLGGVDAMYLWLALAAGGLGAYVAWQLDFMPRIDRVAAVIVLTVATYPFLFAFDRGNIEVVVTLLLAAFVWGLQTDHPNLAAIAIGAAAAMKVYPLIFAALFLVKKQWRQLSVTAVAGLLLSLLGSIYYDFNLIHAINLFRGNVPGYKQAYVFYDGGVAFGCSLWSPLKLLAVDALGGNTLTVHELLPIYTDASAVAAAGIVLALWRLPLRFWEQIALLTFAFDTLPTVSGDYKLLHLVVPMVLFLRYGADDRLRWLYLAGFALLMVPKAYVLLRPDSAPYPWVNLGVVVDPLVMLVLGLTIVAAGLARLYSRIPAPAT